MSHTHNPLDRLLRDHAPATLTVIPATQAEIAERAYAIYLREGSVPGQADRHWAQAEHELGVRNAPAPRSTAQASRDMTNEGADGAIGGLAHGHGLIESVHSIAAHAAADRKAHDADHEPVAIPQPVHVGENGRVRA